MTARGAREATPETLARALRQVETSAQEDWTSRRVVSALAPRDLTDTGLTAALHRTLDSLSQSTGIDATLHVDGDVTSLPTTVEVALPASPRAPWPMSGSTPGPAGSW